MIMEARVVFMSILLGLLDFVKGDFCYFSYYKCSGSDWCCPDGYVCTGSSLCLSIGAVVGICIGALTGLGFFIVVIYLCCRQNKRSVGTVITQPGVTNTTVINQQQSGIQYSQQPMYGQQPYGGQPQYGGQQPYGYSQPSQPAYPPPPPAYS